MVPCAAPLRMAREPRETTLDSMTTTVTEVDEEHKKKSAAAEKSGNGKVNFFSFPISFLFFQLQAAKEGKKWTIQLKSAGKGEQIAL